MSNTDYIKALINEPEEKPVLVIASRMWADFRMYAAGYKDVTQKAGFRQLCRMMVLSTYDRMRLMSKEYPEMIAMVNRVDVWLTMNTK